MAYRGTEIAQSQHGDAQPATESGIPAEIGNLKRAVDVLENAVKRMIERTSPLVPQEPAMSKASCEQVNEPTRSVIGEQIREQRKRVDQLSAALNERLGEMEL